MSAFSLALFHKPLPNPLDGSGADIESRETIYRLAGIAYGLVDIHFYYSNIQMLKVMVGSKLALAPWLQTKTLILWSAMHKNSEPN